MLFQHINGNDEKHVPFTRRTWQKTRMPQSKLSSGWMNVIGNEFTQPYMQKLDAFLQQERARGAVLYPAQDDVFNALFLTPFEKVRVIILGQDPYHGPGQAHGLSFSVRKGVPLPPSLLNIYKEIKQEFGTEIPSHGDLSAWAEQGVLLLNTTLTVEDGRAGSHQGRGWESLTDAIIRSVSKNLENIVFMLWGAHAQKKGALIDRQKHLVLEAPHPSPLSAYRGFLGCGHFKKANDYLKSKDLDAINWTNAP